MAATSHHRTYIPNNRSNSDPETMTRMQQDLATSLSSQDSLETNGHDMAAVRRAFGKVPHVCVIGAGVAGLRCADVLLQHGVKVTILEGRDRVGGRLCQSDALGHKVDLGPNWIHGTENNPILELAKETNTLTMDWDGRQSVFDKLGNQVPAKEAGETIELAWEITMQAMKYSEAEFASKSIPPEKSLYDFFKEKLPEMIPKEMEGDQEVERKREATLEISAMWGAFVGSPIETQSLRFFWLEECIDGENLFVSETYHKILNRIAEPALKSADIKFGHKVQKVVSKGTEGELSVEVVLDGKQSMTFDEVVMTSPLGWLKRNNDAFEPELPEGLKRAIASIGYGHLDKVYITFPTAWWDKPTPGDLTTTTSHDPSLTNVAATTAPIHQPSTSASASPTVDPEHYPGFTHWPNPTYAPETNPSHWPQEAVSLAALPPPSARPTLLFYTYGPTSLHIASLLKSHTSPVTNPDPATHALLTAFFQPYFSRLPNYSASNPSHQPSRILATAWANDELAGYGSYCNFQVGLEAGDRDIETMRRGLPGRGVWFAGEHTGPFVALGTVTGAYWSGEGVGKRILKAWGMGSGREKEKEDEKEINGTV